jgi:glycosyltransferase involved in cell wall biosynthesis
MQFVPAFTVSSQYIVAQNPVVTALISAYNYARYLPFAINSVLNQTYSPIEIIVVDDGSTDHTREVLAQYQGRVLAISTENGGQGHAFNVGISKASGELIMLLDADDIWQPDKVQLMVEFAAKHPNAAMLYHRYQNMDRDGGYQGPPQPFVLRNGNFRRNYLRSGGSWGSPIASVLTLRTEHIRRALPLPTYAVREGADTIVTDYCILTSEVASLPDALTLRRLHGSNLYATGREGFFDRSKATRDSDIRRVEWRMFSLQKLMRRLGQAIDLDLDRNEWRLINMYILGRASFWRLAKALLSAPEHNLKHFVARLRFVLAAKRNESGSAN